MENGAKHCLGGPMCQAWGMIVMFTDFSLQGPYVGQLQGVLKKHAPEIPVISLMHDAPAFNPRASAYLLAALVEPFPAGAVFLCVVDPGVGSQRRAVALKADGRWFVGPDNGLLSVVAKQAGEAEWFEVLWRPENLSNTFHGRDLFAPVAAMLACGEKPEMAPMDDSVGLEWPEQLEQVIYHDTYGNLITGISAKNVSTDTYVTVAGHTLVNARTFAEAEQGGFFWYENSMGLVEVATPNGSAAEAMKAEIGTPVHLQSGF